MIQGNPIFTIGHSTNSIEDFLGRLERHNITSIADVRSTPASKFNPQFNRDSLTRSLKATGISYVFLGKELGARSEDPSCYVDGKVQYDRLAAAPAFQTAIGRLMRGRMTQRIAVLCSEGEPLECHRTLLVARVLVEADAPVAHILGDGTKETHDDSMMRLRAKFNLAEDDLFHSSADLLRVALQKQEDRIAYVDELAQHTGDGMQ